MLEFFFCATLSSWVLCPVNLSCLGFSRWQGLSLQLRSCCAVRWNPSRQKAGSLKSLPVLFPFSQGSLPLCCLLKTVFPIFCLIFKTVSSDKSVNLFPVIPFCPEAENFLEVYCIPAVIEKKIP